MTKPRPMDEQKKSVIWREWERGTPMANIARVIDKPPATVFSYLQYHGGIRPRHRFRRTEALSLKRPAENLNRWDSRGADFVIHPVWEDGSCQHHCQKRCGRGFRD